jgi:hypothetical protein
MAKAKFAGKKAAPFTKGDEKKVKKPVKKK